MAFTVITILLSVFLFEHLTGKLASACAIYWIRCLQHISVWPSWPQYGSCPFTCPSVLQLVRN